jgi:predicted ATPase
LTPEFVRTPIVGRERELALLTTGLEEALRGRGHLYLLSGEPGVGKTRLLEEVAGRAAVRDAMVLWGRCWGGGDAPPFWPWWQILRSLLGRSDSPDDARLQALRTSPPRATGAPSSMSAEEARERFELLDGVTTCVQDAARHKTLVLLLDDLHAADESSLLLLRFVARHLGAMAVLVIAAYREAEAREGVAVADRLGELALGSTGVPVRGIDRPAAGALIGASAGRLPSDQLVAVLHDATAGNPFFLEEIVRLLIAEGRFDESGLRAGQLGVPDRRRSRRARQRGGRRPGVRCRVARRRAGRDERRGVSCAGGRLRGGVRPIHCRADVPVRARHRARGVVR